jgi:hypothetical protein
VRCVSSILYLTLCNCLPFDIISVDLCKIKQCENFFYFIVFPCFSFLVYLDD